MKLHLYCLGAAFLLACSSPDVEVTSGSGAGGQSSSGGSSSGGGGVGGAGGSPVMEPPPACIESSDCDETATPLEVIFEAPPAVELLQATGDGVLGYDKDAQQYVTYALKTSFGPTELPKVVEASRLAPEVDRAEVQDAAAMGLACAGTSCDLWNFSENERIAQVPEELEAKMTSGHCVGGRGIACFDGKGWSHKLGPEALSHPIVALAPIFDDRYVASDGVGAVVLVEDGVPSPLEVGTTSPIVSLVPLGGATWMGLSAAGEFVIGDASGGLSCESGVSRLVPERRAYVRGDLLRLEGASWCNQRWLPEGWTDVGWTHCGIGAEPFVIDGRRIYSAPVLCPVD